VPATFLRLAGPSVNTADTIPAMARRLARALPVLLFMLVAVLYLRTLFASDYLSVTYTPYELRLRVAQDFWSAHLTSSAPPPPPGLNVSLSHGPADRPGLLSWFWWDHYVDHQPTYRTEDWRVQLRPWPLVLLLGLICAFRKKRAYDRRRVARLGLCPSCHYDLRATPDRCPECGHVLQKGTPP
jgi:hypothetical protein